LFANFVKKLNYNWVFSTGKHTYCN